MAAHVGMVRRVENGRLVMGQDEQPSTGGDKTPIPGRELSRNRASYVTETPRGGALRGKKSNPERLTQLLDRLVAFPHVMDACAFTGLSYTSLRYYLAK